MRIDEPPDDEDEGAEIIELRPGQDAQDDDRHMVTRRKTYKCDHRRIALDHDSQRAYCRACDVEVPLFDYLVKLAAGWERFISERREAERRMKVARANLDELLRDERNAKARRRNWRKHEPEAVQHLRALVGLFAQLAGYGHPKIAAAREFLAGEDVARPEVAARP